MAGFTHTTNGGEAPLFGPYSKLRVTVLSLWEIFRSAGISCAETLRPASQTWARSAYLQHRCQELSEILKEMDAKKPVAQAYTLYTSKLLLLSGSVNVLMLVHAFARTLD